MRPLPLLILAVLVPSAALAQDSAGLSPKQDKKGWYRTVKNFSEAGVVARKEFPYNYSLDEQPRYAYCLIPPGADWALDSREEQVEEQYLRFLGLALHLDARSSPEVRGGVIGTCGKLRSPAASADLERLDANWRAICQTPVEASRPGRYTCPKNDGGTPFPPSVVAAESLGALARSPHPKTALRALSLMEDITDRKALFAKTVKEVLYDPKTPLAVRERAAEVLASVHTGELSGHTLASVWGDPANPESLRRAALRGFSLVLGFSEQRDDKGKGPVRDRLHKYVPALAAVIKAETKEKKNGADELTPLGEEARCVVKLYPSRWICYAKLYEADWYEEMRKDAAKGVDACAKDGKLKP